MEQAILKRMLVYFNDYNSSVLPLKHLDNKLNELMFQGKSVSEDYEINEWLKKILDHETGLGKSGMKTVDNIKRIKQLSLKMKLSGSVYSPYIAIKDYIQSRKPRKKYKTSGGWNNLSEEVKKREMMAKYITVYMDICKQLFILSPKTKGKMLTYELEKEKKIFKRPFIHKFVYPNLLNDEQLKLVYSKIWLWNRGKRWEGKIEI